MLYSSSSELWKEIINMFVHILFIWDQSTYLFLCFLWSSFPRTAGFIYCAELLHPSLFLKNTQNFPNPVGQVKWNNVLIKQTLPNKSLTNLFSSSKAHSCFLDSSNVSQILDSFVFFEVSFGGSWGGLALVASWFLNLEEPDWLWNPVQFCWFTM